MNLDGFSSLEARARVHAALGDPGRLAIVDRLLLGDASPGEVGQVLGLPTNLLAHHLKLLQDAGVIERRRSEGDRRRTYLRLVPQSLSGLVPAAARPAPRIVFVCTHNSARSQLAAALWSRTSAVPATSAGTQPASRIHPSALALAARHGLDLGHAATRHVEGTLRPDDLVVAVCDAAHEQLADLERLHWAIPDPVRAGSDEAFERAYTDIADRVQRLAPAIHPPEE
ncbi:putative regulatory protein, ArsR family [Microtetraspora sp. NBRC 13810]|uniref:arsenate reductase/protein-tyrosine-phosphatase family protein n=1 Tax=Microtetraspora sp. NBRC 13810 TaxID=3030990 RepID=UPI0024A1CA1A|nr:helix-turn-helix domain-containing protein [Microtetraspora sp. NBRC 13810]GLW10705.1 putative regulatory protein, ArsR family [Microtetraspora sp. NBRC 13810]